MTTTKLLIPEMTASQSQKHVTFNEALFTLDTLVQLAVLDKDLSAPPGSPTLGDSYIVGGSATGSWLGKENQVATYDGDGWIFFPPNNGWVCWIEDEAEIYFYQAGWSAIGGILGTGFMSSAGGTFTGNVVLEEATPSIRFNDTDITGYTLLQTNGATYEIAVDAENEDASSKFQVTIDGASANFEVNEFGVGIGGASADATNGLAFFGTNILFNSGTSIAQVFNKNLVGNDASFTFQQGFATQALMGLLGNNDFSIKTGPTFEEALVIKSKSGRAVFKKVQNGIRPWNVVQRNHVTSNAWLTSTSAVNNRWRSVTWSPELGLFAAVSDNGTGDRVMTTVSGNTVTYRS